jgi:phosphoserine aminotransferase
MSRKKNFFAGPSVLPAEVLEQLHEDLLDYKGYGLSMIEASHRGQPFEDMYHECLALIRELMGVPDNYDIFFLGGGATLQFSMIPMNFLRPGTVADYIRSGSWGNKAASDAKKLGDVHIYYDGSENNFSSLPDPKRVKPSNNSSYLYLCSNETIGGIEWQDWPDTGAVPLVADMSSDLLSRPVPVENFALIYGGVQKNLGPAGATLVILRKDMLDKQNTNLTAYLDYRVHAEGEGLYNTPPVFSIWAVKLVLEWINNNGGAEGMAKRAALKSSIIYDAIDGSGGYFRSPVDPAYRSKMNIVFRMANEELEKKFLAATKEEGMLGLKGHRSVGGLRASIYNSLPVADVQALADLMKEFQRVNG